METIKKSKVSKLSDSTPNVSAVYKVKFNKKTFIIFKRKGSNWEAYENIKGIDLNDKTHLYNLDDFDWQDIALQTPTKKSIIYAIEWSNSNIHDNDFEKGGNTGGWFKGELSSLNW